MESISSSITIVEASESDAGLICLLGRETFEATHLGANPRPVLDAYLDRAFDLGKIRAELADPGNVFHIAYESGEHAVGYSKIVYDSKCPLSTGPGRLAKLERLYFLSSQQGKRRGWQLLDFNRRLANERGQEGMWLTVWPGNVRAIRFYERVGFSKIGEVHFQLTPEIRNPNDLMRWDFSVKSVLPLLFL